MSQNEKTRNSKNILIEEINKITSLINDGRQEEIDLTLLQELAPPLADNFTQMIEKLEIMKNSSQEDSRDIPQVTRHLTHIAQTTEKGVMSVINNTESVMGDVGDATDKLNSIEKLANGNKELSAELESVRQLLDTVQNNCFTIITSVEFDDINRQLTDKIIARLNRIYENLSALMMDFNIAPLVDSKDSAFLEDLKHIIDLDGANIQSQDMVDELFDDFESF